MLGDCIQDHDFKDAIIDEFISYSETKGEGWIPNEDVKYVYGNTPENSSLRRALVRITVERWCSEKAEMIASKSNRQLHTVDYLSDVLAGHNQFTCDAPERIWYCKFHEHRNGACYHEKFRGGDASEDSEMEQGF